MLWLRMSRLNTSTELVPLDGSFALPGPFQVRRFEETTLNWNFFLGSFCPNFTFISCRLHQGETWPSSLHHSTKRRIICFDRRYHFNNLLIPSLIHHPLIPSIVIIDFFDNSFIISIVIIDFFDQRH